MEELLIKLNMIRKHNEVIRLKREISQKESENSTLKEDFKKTFDVFDKKISSISEGLYRKVDALEGENRKLKTDLEILERENLAYKEQIENIPKFILRLFNKKRLLRGNNGEK